VQWDIFPSAACLLRGESRGDPDEETRVVVVPRLWIDALSEPDKPFMGCQFVVLTYELDDWQRTTKACSAVAVAIGRSCRAGALSCRQWSPVAPDRIAYERSARETAASALNRRM
jgi:hypothetical protein